MSKTAAPRVDLNDASLLNFGDQTPFLPYGNSRVTVRLKSFVYHAGYKGKAYRAKFEIVTSDREDIRPGYAYNIHFKFELDELKQSIMMKNLRAFVAAAFGASPTDAGYDGNEGLNMLLELSSADALEGENISLDIVSVDKHQVDKATKEVRKNSDGSPKTVTNRFFNAVKKTAAA